MQTFVNNGGKSVMTQMNVCLISSGVVRFTPNAAWSIFDLRISSVTVLAKKLSAASDALRRTSSMHLSIQTTPYP
jgi:hypothetical protein